MFWVIPFYLQKASLLRQYFTGNLCFIRLGVSAVRTCFTIAPWHGQIIPIITHLVQGIHRFRTIQYLVKWCRPCDVALMRRYGYEVGKCEGARSLQWLHNGRDGVSNHQPYHCLLNCLFRRRSKKTSKLRVIGLFAVNYQCIENGPWYERTLIS